MKTPENREIAPLSSERLMVGTAVALPPEGICDVAGEAVGGQVELGVESHTGLPQTLHKGSLLILLQNASVVPV
jgi:hypothetical protein